jgi:hypothetical protein
VGGGGLDKILLLDTLLGLFDSLLPPFEMLWPGFVEEISFEEFCTCSEVAELLLFKAIGLQCALIVALFILCISTLFCVIFCE